MSVETKTITPDHINRVGRVLEFYVPHYRKNFHNTPYKSRTSIIRKAYPYIQSLPQGGWVLDVGAGRQLVERDLMRKYGDINCRMVTLDLPISPAEDLLVKDSNTVDHIFADGLYLPFRDETFSFLICNMAFECMSEEVIGEMRRVLKPQSHALVNFWDKDNLPENLDELVQDKKIRGRSRRLVNFRKFLRDNNMLVSSSDEVVNLFTSYGFVVKTLQQAHDNYNVWWEVDVARGG
ncbi:class I SAM-dependent methyltransferase [Candidatus Microgenomates bacterium]|nr:class I SAM-dependent methyltransferase [Candidatus Microgenomates bacterium]